MTAISADASVTNHTLPSYFGGLGVANFRYQDFSNSSYRAALASVNPQHLRLNPWGNMGTVSSPDPGFTAMRGLVSFLGCATIMGPTAGAPAGAPNTSRSTADTTNVAANGSGSSPQDAADWFHNFKVTNGINVTHAQFYNEPQNCVFANGAQGPWYGTAAACDEWAFMAHRLYQQAMAAKASTDGVSTPKITAVVESTVQPYVYNWVRFFCSPHSGSTTIFGGANGSIDGNSWPWSDDNWNYFDIISLHCYANGSTDQGKLNAIYWRPTNFTTYNDSVGLLKAASYLNSFFSSQGHSSKLFGADEQALDDSSWRGGFWDVAFMIAAAGYSSQYGIDYMSQWSANCSNTQTGGGILPLMDTSYSLWARGCVLRDMVFHFLNTYPNIVAFGETGANTPASGENTGLNNSSPRVKYLVGKSNDGTKIGWIEANIDLTNDEANLVHTLTGATFSGNITGKYLDSTVTVRGSTPLPSITPITPSNGSWTRTLPAGQAVLFEGTIGGGGPTIPSYQQNFAWK